MYECSPHACLCHKIRCTQIPSADALLLQPSGKFLMEVMRLLLAVQWRRTECITNCHTVDQIQRHILLRLRHQEAAISRASEVHRQICRLSLEKGCLTHISTSSQMMQHKQNAGAWGAIQHSCMLGSCLLTWTDSGI